MKPLRMVGLLFTMCAVACSDAMVGPSTGGDRGALFDNLWTEFDLHYSFFVLKRINWDSLRAVYRPQALRASGDEAFAAAMGRMLGALQDVHVSLTPSGAGGTLRYLSRFETAPTFFDVQRLLTRYVPSSRTTPGGHIQFGIAAPTVGYVYIAAMQGEDLGGEMADAINGLASARSLIVDVRNNPGGAHAMVAALAGRFADDVRTYSYVRRRNGPAHDDFTDYVPETIGPVGDTRFRGHVYVLANRGSVSSAEDFVLAMRSLPNVTILGDTTAGYSGGPIVRELANGWTYQLSEWIQYTIEHRSFEGVGLAPDVIVQATASDAAVSVDAALERAVALALGFARGS